MLRERSITETKSLFGKPSIGDIVTDVSGAKYKVKAVGLKMLHVTNVVTNEEVHLMIKDAIQTGEKV